MSGIGTTLDWTAIGSIAGAIAAFAALVTAWITRAIGLRAIEVAQTTAEQARLGLARRRFAYSLALYSELHLAEKRVSRAIECLANEFVEIDGARDAAKELRSIRLPTLAVAVAEIELFEVTQCFDLIAVQTQMNQIKGVYGEEFTVVGANDKVISSMTGLLRTLSKAMKKARDSMQESTGIPKFAEAD